jgi:plasmid stability protein
MSTTLTIRNLEKPVKHLLRIQAASHKRSMEAEARDILTRAVTSMDVPGQTPNADTVNAVAMRALNAVRGKWQGRSTTDALMQELRGED